MGVSRTLFALLVILTFLDHPVQAQYADGRHLGLGGIIGTPSGLSVKKYDRPDFAYDVLAAWDLNRFVFLNIHGVYEHPIRRSPLNVFLGPGAFIGLEDKAGSFRLASGISALFGLNFFTEQFEVFVQLSPRLELISRTNGYFGGGVGLRYYP